MALLLCQEVSLSRHFFSLKLWFDDVEVELGHPDHQVANDVRDTDEDECKWLRDVFLGDDLFSVCVEFLPPFCHFMVDIE